MTVTSLKLLADKSFINRANGPLATYNKVLDFGNDASSPIRFVTISIEDDRSMAGQGDNRDKPFQDDVFGMYDLREGIYQPLRSNDQNFIACETVGYKAMQVMILKVMEDGSHSYVNHQQLLVQSNFRSILYVIFNKPTQADAGAYICMDRFRVWNQELHTDAHV